jgi:hypothetical protein
MKVMPNNAITTVITPDSKYSRTTLFGGPLTGADGGGFFSWPLRFNSREKTEGFVSVSVAVSRSVNLSVVGFVAIEKTS